MTDTTNDTSIGNPLGLKPGDTVILKSGGPRMTIARIKGDEAFVVWATLERLIKVDDFIPLVCLNRV